MKTELIYDQGYAAGYGGLDETYNKFAQVDDIRMWQVGFKDGQTDLAADRKN